MEILDSQGIQWRSYQQQVLAQLEQLSSDQQIHIVAPPGAGKTYLGIELIRRLKRSALILVPSNTLKMQWLETIKADFLVNPKMKELLSDDILQPKEITVDTYQGMYAAAKKQDLAKVMNKFQVETFIFDEAHHLKKSWFQILQQLKNELSEATIISLTATPPYDSSPEEWKNYLSLNGAIDYEITTPELVQSGELSPYQDLVYLIEADAIDEAHKEQLFQEYQRNLAAVSTNPQLLEAIQALNFVIAPKESTEFIYQNFQLYVAALLFLYQQVGFLSQEQLEVLGMTPQMQKKDFSIPAFKKEHLRILLDYCLMEQLIPDLAEELSRFQFYKKQKLNLSADYLWQNTAKCYPERLAALGKVLNQELMTLKNELRAVILTDWTGKEYLTQPIVPEAYGVVPIFDFIQQDSFIGQESLVAVSGSFLIIPTQLQPAFEHLINQEKFSEYSNTANYVVCSLSDQIRSKAVQLITELIEENKIAVLISTAALLGEGWNAPAINTLLLATQSSSFVQTHQLHGRAIRNQKEQIKTANIWHFSLVYHNQLLNKFELEKLGNRLSHLSGLTYSFNPKIEAGLERFEFPLFYEAKDIRLYNQMQFFWSTERAGLTKRWQRALAKGHSLATPYFFKEQGDLKKDELEQKKPTEHVIAKHSFKQAAGILLTNVSLGAVCLTVFRLSLPSSALVVLGGIIGSVAVVNAKQISQRLIMGRERRQKEKIRQATDKVVRAIFKTALELRYFQRAVYTDLMTIDEDTAFGYYLQEASYYDGVLFAELLDEAFSELSSPSYLVQNLKPEKCLQPYYNVPEAFGKNKRTLQAFVRNWKAEVSSKSECFFTKSIAGRKRLVEARMTMYQLGKSNYRSKAESLWL